MSPRKTARGTASRPRKLTVALRSMTWGERLDVIDALAQVLEQVYVHLPLKRSLYGFDAVRGLEHLRQQAPGLSDLQFHRELTSLVNRLRDAHTQYRGPWHGDDPVASLPFLVEAYGPADRPVYVVSKVDRQSVRDRHFVVGVTIHHWNGVPFDRAVDLHAESATGGRPDARRARALESLTFRPLDFAPPPNEEWVVLGYQDLKGQDREIRLEWEGLDPGRAPAASRRVATRVRRAIDPGGEAVRRAKKYRFNHELWEAERPAAPGAARGGRRGAGDGRAYDDFLTSRTVVTRHGRFGYLRIWSFDVDDDEEFIAAAVRRLRRLPDRGLIIDLRANPGGYIVAAERMLQLFTPNRVSPTRFALRATRLTAAMARAPFNQMDLAPWGASLAAAEQTGEPYSSHLPITPPGACNDIGQHYGGPVVAVVDANTYSSGDLFAAGFVDNRIGPVVCVGEATGAGGANVWSSEILGAALRAAKSPLPTLPDGVEFTVSLRRAVRTNDAEGTLIEDAGIVGQRYDMTRDDVFENNRDLVEHCAELLSSQPCTRMRITRRGRTLTVECGGLEQLDLYVDGRPGGATTTLRGDGRRRLRVPEGAGEVEVVGWANGSACQRRRLRLGDDA